MGNNQHQWTSQPAAKTSTFFSFFAFNIILQLFIFIQPLFNEVSPIEIKDLLYEGDLVKNGNSTELQQQVNKANTNNRIKHFHKGNLDLIDFTLVLKLISGTLFRSLSSVCRFFHAAGAVNLKAFLSQFSSDCWNNKLQNLKRRKTVISAFSF